MKILLFSGGIDSTCLAYWQKPDCLLHINYGQVCAEGEVRAAAKISEELDIRFDNLTADCKSFGSGQMAEAAIHNVAAPEFWPYRNQLLITLAAMLYYDDKDLEILIGTVRTDSVHPDGTKIFYDSAQKLLKTQGSSKIKAPALDMTSLELITHSKSPKSLLGWSFSCHISDRACGQCRGCHKHNKIVQAI